MFLFKVVKNICIYILPSFCKVGPHRDHGLTSIFLFLCYGSIYHAWEINLIFEPRSKMRYAISS